MLTIRAMSNGSGYAGTHLQNNDYYDEQSTVIGEWFGIGAELLGLSGIVDLQTFEALREGLHPITGDKLRPRTSADRVDDNGEKRSAGRNLYDFTFSAPKSVSIMACVGGDDRLFKAHEHAVHAALQVLESHAATRVRLGGADEDRVTGNLAAACYLHDASRSLDPQIHTHACAFNLTYDGIEGRWKALQAGGIYERRAYLTEVYRNVLAREVEQLGYTAKARRDEKGRDRGFELEGVSPALIEKFSQRSAQRDVAVAEFKRKHGREPTDNEVAQLVRDSRPDKLTSISTAEVKAQQQGRLTNEERAELKATKEAARGHSVVAGRGDAYASLQFAIDHIFERLSVTDDFLILQTALQHGRGQIDHTQLMAALKQKELSGEVFRSGSEMATKASLERERHMVAIINDRTGERGRLGGEKSKFKPFEGLRAEQAHAVEFILNSRDFAVNLSGAAGTGKTNVLQQIRSGLEAAGRLVLGVAPTQSAVEELRKVGFGRAETCEKLIQDESRTDFARMVLIIDEAGMVSSRQMDELLTKIHRGGGRVIFSGDTRQIQSVEAGDALLIFERESNLKGAVLREVQRQKPTEYREAVQKLRHHPEEGFERLQAMGAVQEVAWDVAGDAVAAAYQVEQARLNMEGKPSKVLVVCPTHEKIREATQSIRATRKARGELPDERAMHRLEQLNWTLAQRKQIRDYVPGQWIVFHKMVNYAARNQAFEVVRVEGDKLIVRNDQGKERKFDHRQAKSFNVFAQRPIDVAAGEQLLLQANRTGSRFRSTNGEIVTVSEIDRHGRIHLADGRIMPADFRHFTHGYAVTAHRSQGKTVDSVLVYADRMTRELFYVAATRARERLAVITGSAAALLESICRSGQRQSATELNERKERTAPPATEPGKGRAGGSADDSVVQRGMAAARAMMRAGLDVARRSSNREETLRKARHEAMAPKQTNIPSRSPVSRAPVQTLTR